MAQKQVEVVGRIRGLDGMDFPKNKGCQVFFRQANGNEIVLLTRSHPIQTLFELAFSKNSEATVVYTPKGALNLVVQIRFNQSGDRLSPP